MKKLLTFLLILSSGVMFSQYRISTEGASRTFAYENISTGVIKNYPREYVSAEARGDNIYIYLRNGSGGENYFPTFTSYGLAYTEFRDGNNSDATFASAAAVVDWFYNNTGFKTASGGSGAVNVLDYGARPDDGIDDTGAIQAAFTASGEGDDVYLPPGNYIVSSRLTLSGKTNVSIIGFGATLVSTDVDFTQALHGHPMLYLDDCVRTSVIGLRFDMTGTLTTNEVSAIVVEDSDDTLIENCEAWGANSNGTFLEGDCDRSIWRGCIARDSRNTTRGFWLGNINSSQFTRQLTVTECKAFGLGFSGIIAFSDGARIENNYSYNNAGSGIVIPGDPTAIVKDVVVVGNHCEGNTFYGIQQDPTGTGGIFNNTIVGNTTIGNTQGGILLNGCTNTTVTGNSVKNNLGRGIEVEDETFGAVISGNILVDDQGTATQDDGVQINIGSSESVTDVLIEGNHIEGNQNYGIEFQTTVSSSSFDGVYIKNNTIKSNGTYGIFSAHNGTTITNLQIEGNEFDDHATRDIRLTGISSLTGVVVRNNRWDKDKTQFDAARDGFNSAAPSAGTWAVGDIVYDSAPSAAGTIGWVCTVAGSPGTWKAFGTIEN